MGRFGFRRHLFTEGPHVPVSTDHRSSGTGRANLPLLAPSYRRLAELLASKPDRQLLGQTEFEVRDRVHKIGAKALETALDERKKGGIKGPA